MSFHLFPKDKRKTELINIRLERELFERLKKKAEEDRSSISELIRIVLREACVNDSNRQD